MICKLGFDRNKYKCGDYVQLKYYTVIILKEIKRSIKIFYIILSIKKGSVFLEVIRSNKIAKNM